MDLKTLKNIIEAILLSADKPLDVQQLGTMLEVENEQPPGRDDIRQALAELQADYEGRGFELKEVSSGFRMQVRQDYASWVGRLWEEKPPKYSRALLETLVLIAYRQPITRGEIEEIRGVTVSSHIAKTLMERDWIRVLGHKDVPGKPAMYGTTKAFLDYFNLKSLNDLPPLSEIKDLDKLHPELALDSAEAANDGNSASDEEAGVEEAAIDSSEAEISSDQQQDTEGSFEEQADSTDEVTETDSIESVETDNRDEMTEVDSVDTADNVDNLMEIDSAEDDETENHKNTVEDSGAEIEPNVMQEASEA